MRCHQIQGEPTRYYVESSMLECPLCKKTASVRETRHKALKEGDSCPFCAKGRMGTRWHLVDLAAFRPIGQCSCEHFTYRLQANLNKLSPSQLFSLSQGEAAKLRCTHIEAARALALDLTVSQHVKTQEHLSRNPGRHGNGIGA